MAGRSRGVAVAPCGSRRDPIDYRWCAYAAATGGDEAARKGTERVVFGAEDARQNQAGDFSPEAVGIKA